MLIPARARTSFSRLICSRSPRVTFSPNAVPTVMPLPEPKPSQPNWPGVRNPMNEMMITIVNPPNSQRLCL